MEDSKPELDLIVKAIKKFETIPKDFQSIKFAGNQDEAISLWEKGYHIYILDISMGNDRAQEGLDALERLKKKDSDNIVAILSANLENHRGSYALKRADIVQRKTSDRRRDIEEIILKMLKIRLEDLKGRLKDLTDSLAPKSEKIDQLLSHYPSDLDLVSSELRKLDPLVPDELIDKIEEKRKGLISSSLEDSNLLKYRELKLNPSRLTEDQGKYVGDEIEKKNEGQISSSSPDPNLAKYQELKSDPSWLKENRGKYVVLVEGELRRISEADSSCSGEDLLEWLIKSEEFHNKKKFFAQVTEDSTSTATEIVDEPSSFSFDGFSY
ncbi:MAG: response regulator [Pseudanabaenales cyanobacterium]|nr:response regulator [Pseudanabaenales cyanobacterium]